MGKLITEGSAAGTPDYGSWPSKPIGHTLSDVTPFWACCEIGRIEDYLAMRPPNNGKNCPKNRVDKPLRCERWSSNPYVY
jgi:hypothetical protein